MYKFLNVQMQTYLTNGSTYNLVTFEGDESSAKKWLDLQFGHSAKYFKPVKVSDNNN